MHIELILKDLFDCFNNIAKHLFSFLLLSQKPNYYFEFLYKKEVFNLHKINSNWKISSFEIFAVQPQIHNIMFHQKNKTSQQKKKNKT